MKQYLVEQYQYQQIISVIVINRTLFPRYFNSLRCSTLSSMFYQTVTLYSPICKRHKKIKPLQQT